MTTLYPSQSTPSFLKKYTRNVYNRVQYNAHHDGHQNIDEAQLSLQVRNERKEEKTVLYRKIGKMLFNQIEKK